MARLITLPLLYKNGYKVGTLETGVENKSMLQFKKTQYSGNR
jgi:hypothetical protein